MLVTEIKKAKKGLVTVTVDGKAFELNAETVAAAGIDKNSTLSECEFLALCKQSDCDRAKSRALWHLSRADHSRRALYDKLCRTYGDEAASAATARMEELGLIDDYALASRLASGWSAANVSNKEILRKLFAKGIPSEIAKQAVEELSPDSQAQIKQLLETKYRTRLKNEDGVRKVYAALIRKGFSYSDVRTALKEYSEILENCEE